MKTIARYFLEGLLLAAPVGITLYVMLWIAKIMDQLNPTSIPGVGVLITVVFVTLGGYYASNYLARAGGRQIDELFSRLPFVKILYLLVKEIIDAFVGAKKGFGKPVLVTLIPGGAVSVIGFITIDSLDSLGLKDKVGVYLPESYNFAGQLIVVPADQLTPIDIPSSAVMAVIASGGISTYSKK